MARSTAIKTRPVTRKSGTSTAIRTYRSALNYLNSAINFERQSPKILGRTTFTLGRMQRLLAALGNPHREVKTVHIVGTKGKGSTLAMLGNMLQGCGFKVGDFTSPHILDVRERIKVNGTMISEARFTRLMKVVARAARKPRVGDPTYFELLTAVAFLHFVELDVDIALIEAGLGGRLDSTNIISPEVIGMTAISLDHTAYLGTTLASIAQEKSGVFKRGVTVVCSPQREDVDRIFRAAASEVDAPIRMIGKEIGFSCRFESSRGLGPHTRICITAPTNRYDHVHAPLLGDHQAINCAVALGLLDVLKTRGFEIDDQKAFDGLATVKLAGRMEMICDEPRIMVDGAHNAASVDATMRAIGQNVPYDSMVIIFACQKDKDISGMLRYIRLGADKVIFTKTGSPRSADPVDLAAEFSDMSSKMCQVADSLEEALSIANRAVTRDDLICITGSFYLVGRAKRLQAKLNKKK